MRTKYYLSNVIGALLVSSACSHTDENQNSPKEPYMETSDETGAYHVDARQNGSDVSSEETPAGLENDDESGFKSKVTAFAKRPYFGEFPYAEVKGLGKKAIPHLVSMLNDDREKNWWTNGIAIVGFLEDSEGYEYLLKFFDSLSGELDDASYRAATAVPFAVGCIASNGDKNALEFLMNHALPENWDDIQFTYKGQDVAAALAQRTISAVAISGRPESEAFLQRMKARAEGEKNFRGKETYLRHIEDGMKDITALNTKGRDGYFGGNI